MTYTGEENYVVFWDGEIIGLKWRKSVDNLLREFPEAKAFNRWEDEVFLSDY